MAVLEDFAKLDIRCGAVSNARLHPKAKKPSYILTVDFGPEIGIKTSSTQITELYQPQDLIGRQVLGIVNLPPRNVGGVLSEVLILGCYTPAGVVLSAPERPTPLGSRLG